VLFIHGPWPLANPPLRYWPQHKTDNPEKKAKEEAKAAVQKMSSKELKEKAAEGCPYAKKRLLGNNSSQNRLKFDFLFRAKEKTRG
jgi:hypothetical protein